MNETSFEQIQASAEYLDLDLSTQEMAQLALTAGFSDEQIVAVETTFSYLQKNILGLKNFSGMKTIIISKIKIAEANKRKPNLKSPKNVVTLKPKTDPKGDAVWINEVITVLYFCNPNWSTHVGK